MGLSYRITEGKSPRAERELSTQTPRLTCPLPLCQSPSAQVQEKGEQLTPLHSISQLTFRAGRNKGHECTTNYRGDFPAEGAQSSPAGWEGTGLDKGRRGQDIQVEDWPGMCREVGVDRRGR